MKRLLLLALLLTAGFAHARKPNVIVIFTDDHGYADLSSQGVFEDVRTPHIDALARGGVRMSAGYVTAPQCVPSRAGLLSGRYQNRFGVESNGMSLDGFNRQRTIAERLRDAGYATGMTGKWHLGPAPEIGAHGFDDVYYKNANRPGWANYDLAGKDVEPGPERSRLYHIDANSAAACAFIDRHHDEPFFFYCAYRAPHVPLDAPKKYLDRFPGKMPERRRQALAMLSAVDDGVGRIVATLRRHGLEEQTLIFFIGDNGAPLKIHKLDAPGGGPGWDGSLNDPMNGEKGMLSEGGIRVPFVVSWQGRIPGGQVYDHPVISLDVAATAVALAGLPADPELDGVNLIPYLRGERDGAPHDALYWRWVAQGAIRVGDWKYLRGGAREYLFNLRNDPEEKRNLMTAERERAQLLADRLAAWAKDLQPPGLEMKSMSKTWEAYFDFYLDGKPPAPLREKFLPSATAVTNSVQGWIARNAKISEAGQGLVVKANGARERQKPFLVISKLDLSGPVEAIIRLQSAGAGKVGVAWREQGQKDFAAEQVKSVAVAKTDEAREVTLKFTPEQKLIHLRVLLPAGDSTIERITLKTAKAQKSWVFGPR